MTAPYTFSQMQQQGYARPPQQNATSYFGSPGTAGSLYGGAATQMGYAPKTAPTAPAPSQPQAQPPMPQYTTSSGTTAPQPPAPSGNPLMTGPTGGMPVPTNSPLAGNPNFAWAGGSPSFNESVPSATSSMGYGQGNQALYNQIPQALMQQLQTPTGWTQDAVKQLIDTSNAGLNQQEDVDKQFIREDMARRGLGDSTIQTGRYGDLARATDLNRRMAAAQILNQAAAAAGPGRANAIAQALGYGQTGFENQLATSQLNNQQNQYQDQFWLQMMQQFGGA